MFSTLLKKSAPAAALAVGAFLTVPALHAQDLRGPTTIIVVTPEYSVAQAEASDLLRQVRDNAYQLSKESDQLVSLTRSNISRASYASALSRIKAQINTTGDQLAQLQRLRDQVAPWQQAAIDRITPIAQELAANTTSAIEHINESPNRLSSPDYRDTLYAIADGAQQMKTSVSTYLDLAQAQQRVDDLQMKILANS